MPRSRPSVTVVVTAYNHERFVAEAVDSALAQDYPAELVDVVVVNDGSADDTRRVLDERFAAHARVRLVHQDNRGFVGAVNRGLEEVRGDLVALLDADDTWPLDRLRRLATVLAERPEVGLVHGDMEIVDAAGAVLHESFFAYSRFDLRRGRVLAPLIAQCFISGGASLWRAAYLDVVHPIPEQLVYPDWYIGARIAERAEIDHVDGSVNQYRMHGANMGLGGTGEKFFSDMRNNVRIQRWMLGHLDTSDQPVDEVGHAASTMLARTERCALELGLRPTAIHVVTDAHRAAAAERAGEARTLLDRGRLDAAIRGYVAALALDPFDGGARADLAVATARRQRLVTAAAEGSGVPETRDAAVVAFAAELAAAPDMLARYARSVSGAEPVTLVIAVAPAEADTLIPALADAAAAAGLEDDGAADVLLHACASPDELLLAPLCAIYTREEPPAALRGLPRLDDATVGELSGLLPAAA